VLILSRQNIDLLAIRQSSRFDLLGQTTQSIIQILLENNEAITLKLQAQTDAINNLTIRTSKWEAIEQPPQKTGLPNYGVSSQNTKNQISPYEVTDNQDPTNYTGITDTAKRTPLFQRESLSQVAIRAKFEASILNRLYFVNMTERQDEVADAHEKTFNWIYSDHPSEGRSWDNLAKWLADSDTLYWINGKAGSGKSTLMKYLQDKKQTNQLLMKWSNDLPLVTARFFAWNAGDPLQKSQEGLLRSLLYECLSQCGALTPLAFPQLWQNWAESYELDIKPILPHSLTVKQLKDAVLFLVNQDALKVKFCFFVDGLDEYQGEQNLIAQLFRDVAMSRSSKACVSSRPLVLFEHAFRGYPTLTLQELTYDDIKAFVRTKFEESPSVSYIRAQEPDRINDLEENIVKRASGVFLWVKIVVDSLLEGLQNYDRASDLQRRLEALPTDLEMLYLHMFKSLDPIYLEQASRLFQIVTTAQTSLSPLTLALADDEDPNYVFKAKVCVQNAAEIDQWCKNVEGRLKSRCRGLLEIQLAKPTSILATNRALRSGFHDARVEWLHKTVPDYLRRPDIRDLIESRCGEDFNADIALLKASILELKLAVSTRSAFRDVVRGGFRYAARAETTLCVAQNALLDEFYKSITEKWVIVSIDSGDTWPSYVEGWISPSVDSKSAFFILCVMYGLYYYVRYRLDEESSLIRHDFDLSLLRFAVLPSPLTLYDWQRSPQLVRLLLERGADPNIHDDETTPWEATLNCIYHDLRRSFDYARWPLTGEQKEIAQQWSEIVEALIQHGAKPNAKNRGVSDWGTADEYSASEVTIDFPLWVVKETFSKWIPARGMQIEKMLKRGPKNKHDHHLLPTSPLSEKAGKRRSISGKMRRLFTRSPSAPSSPM
jgi:hypothetical protein